jgi:type II secretion system protein C
MGGVIELPPPQRLARPTSARDLWETIQLMELVFAEPAAAVGSASPFEIKGELDQEPASGAIELARPVAQDASGRLAHAPLLVSLVLGTLITAEFARAALSLMGGSASAPPLPVPVTVAAAGPKPRTVDVQGIVAAHLFGAVVDDPNSRDPAHAPQSTTNLALAGTLATEDPRQGFAIISDGGRATLYRVGDEVADGSLHSVYRDHVLLRRHGRLESLLLPRLLPAKSGPGATAAPASRVAAEAGDAPAQRSRSAGDVLQGGGIVAPGGKLRGFRIFPAGGGRVFNESGLRGGDLVVAINGTSLEEQDRQTGQKLFNSMKSSSQATITIERGGLRRDVTINAATAGPPDPSDSSDEPDPSDP